MSDLKTPEVPISKIDVDPKSNVRSHIDEEKLKGLTSTIEVLGVMEAVTVRPKAGGRFDLIAGERRFTAAKRVGLKKVPVTLGKDDGTAAAGKAGPEIAAATSKIAQRFAIVGVVLAIASAAGVC